MTLHVWNRRRRAVERYRRASSMWPEVLASLVGLLVVVILLRVGGRSFPLAASTASLLLLPLVVSPGQSAHRLRGWFRDVRPPEVDPAASRTKSP